MKKKISIIISFLMMFSCLGMNVYADEEIGDNEEQQYEEVSETEETSSEESKAVIDKQFNEAKEAIAETEKITESEEAEDNGDDPENTEIEQEPTDEVTEAEDAEPEAADTSDELTEEEERISDFETILEEAPEISESIPAESEFRPSSATRLASFIMINGKYEGSNYIYDYDKDIVAPNKVSLIYNPSEGRFYFLYVYNSGSNKMSALFSVTEDGTNQGIYMVTLNSTNYYACDEYKNVHWMPSLTWHKGSDEGSIVPPAYQDMFNALTGVAFAGVELTFANNNLSIHIYDFGFDQLYSLSAPERVDLDVGQTATITVSTIPSYAATDLEWYVHPSMYISGTVSGKTATITADSEGGETITVVSDNDESVTITVNCLEPGAFRFDDVKDPSKYYFYAVYWAYKKKITTGTTPTTFEPTTTCTRGHIVTFLWRLAGSPEPETTASFVDVKPGAWYEKAVSWAAENNITTGTTPTTFEPTAPCTRAHIVTFLWRFMNEPVSYASMPFTDVKLSSWYGPAVRWAYENGITTGKTATIFDPSGPCTRGQGVLFLQRTAMLDTYLD